MKVLFLDFDGVLNNKAWFVLNKTIDMFLEPDDTFRSNLDPHNMRIISYILKNIPDLKIVLSTSWRNSYKLDEIRSSFSAMGFKDIADRIIDKTSRKSSRSQEILKWVDSNVEVTNWMTIDDRAIFNHEKHKIHELKTNSLTGITINDAIDIIKYFDPNFKEPIVLI